MSGQVLQLDGTNSVLKVFDDGVVIERKGLFGLRDVEKIPYQKIHHINLVEGGLLLNGYLHLQLKGKPELKDEDAYTDKYSVIFRNKLNADAARIADYIGQQSVIARAEQSQVPGKSRRKKKADFDDPACPVCKGVEMESWNTIGDFELFVCDECGLVLKDYSDKQVALTPDNKVMTRRK